MSPSSSRATSRSTRSRSRSRFRTDDTSGSPSRNRSTSSSDHLYAANHRSNSSAGSEHVEDCSSASNSASNDDSSNGDPSGFPRRAFLPRRSSSFFKPTCPRHRVRSQSMQAWSRTKSAVMNSSALRWQVLSMESDNDNDNSSDGLDAPPLPRVTTEEFEALPPIIQRKYFSELERLRLVRHFGVSQLPTSTSAALDNFGPPLPTRTATAPPVTAGPERGRRRTTRRAHTAAEPDQVPTRGRTHFSTTEAQFYASLPDKIKRRYLSENEKLLAQPRPHSVTPSTAEEAFIKLQNKRLRQQARAMASRTGDYPPRSASHLGTYGVDSFYDSFRWMDENDGLDLRLNLDDYQYQKPEVEETSMPSPNQQITRRPSFRRHMSKLSFSRPSMTHSRPATKDAEAPPLHYIPGSAPGSSNGHHTRRVSKAMSLMSPNKQAVRDSATVIDPAAAHYRDPGARMTLREYLASPKKFDEALEYGFPSFGDMGEQSTKGATQTRDADLDNIRSFLNDDRSSTHSNDDTVSDPDSPKTPPMMEKSSPAQPSRALSGAFSPQLDYGDASANPREMTMRMTLTRPDLRANEDLIYGWQKSAAARKAHMTGESLAPILPERESGLKGNLSIEKQFEAFDQEIANNSQDDGVVRRFWKRVRRN